MRDNDYLKKVSSKPLFRVMAWICLVIIALLFAALIITGVTGSNYFLPCLALCLVVPVLMYVFLWVGKVLSDVGEEKKDGRGEK